VHLDDNLRRAMLQQPLLVEPGGAGQLSRALWEDTSFLARLGVMDYSLLVGIDRGSGTLVVALIDFIRQYTWDKQLETWVKSSGLLGGGGKARAAPASSMRPALSPRRRRAQAPTRASALLPLTPPPAPV
jgi:hypothetical protein